MRIGAHEIGPDTPPVVIAEIGVNHDGSVDRAHELVQAAADAGCQAVKFQYFEAARLLSRDACLASYQAERGARDPLSLLEPLELSTADLETLFDAARRRALAVVLTVFSVELVATAAPLGVDAFKTASPDIINRPLITTLMATGRPLLVSTGAASDAEVADATRWLGAHPHLLFHCVSSYPTPDDEAALAGRSALMTLNPNALGYSDHTQSVDTGALAVAGGACVLEKHLTHARDAAGPDHAASLEPAQMAMYVQLARRAWRMRGPCVKRVTPIEQDVRVSARQSITVTRDLDRDHVLSAADLTLKRPGTGLSPARWEHVVGRTLARPIAENTPLTAEHLA